MSLSPNQDRVKAPQGTKNTDPPSDLALSFLIHHQTAVRGMSLT